ncbi:uncharacterized protein LOC9645841 [Selaginella moellendorffii]|uniref:uncharacterized protein LOC9645841 n=1 Tax=Selaginella moellendorffii TaxID=88036 RepID=UPI000D1C32D2|nr:uncharacterized protein LOC9645841 [Selaginella moellendorffii]XP_024536854.1 uncharacterized protein LOC9645841 [Selaginella moellendorffii]XP_024536855.1 uncharacterized protein LOC9645841 [Selaginella moellendorffii]XP_024536856.1 uncharacterized protein LOC9645841 [Selaginella moellendorffii]XP_024536857.1 uncharacterized protein LOC9645841 [Selaginella moellendorffii]XP_024536858.1 uncharacterized protein LOC9645841 [Selaginella moellendorffii]XP_024536859.1 uncharacterized protein LO|eukprot:XP_024536853.1 uncharacterized protein LOC9645841 [Selaginella moellendorffii]
MLDVCQALRHRNPGYLHLASIAATSISTRRSRIRCEASSAKESLALIVQRCAKGESYPQIDERILLDVGGLDLRLLMTSAAAIRDSRPDSSIITFSPKAFIPLTRACRDSCGYCAFARAPKPGKPVYMSLDEVLSVASRAAELGCTEALFTLGDKPELLYPQAKEELASLGHSTTIEYVAEAAKLVLEKTGLLAHVNAGVMCKKDVSLLRSVSVSQGLMLESTASSLAEPGGPHFNCPDKVPSARIATIAIAGELKVPFTSGLLVGIGETRSDRIKSLLLLRGVHEKYGHIQELIIQNFRAKKGTPMENAAEPNIDELLWTVAMARILFGPDMSIQAPPNLTPRDDTKEGVEWELLINAGINDWGGISPLTRDWVNPELPWPHIRSLASATMQCDKLLVPRLPVYPSYIRNFSSWLDPNVLRYALASSNSLGYGRADPWSPGCNATTDWSQMNNATTSSVYVGIQGNVSCNASARASSRVEYIVDKGVAGEDLTRDEITMLFYSMGPDFDYICSSANRLRESVNGNKVTYVVNRNINYTNVCSYKCQFCAFSKGKQNENLRGKPYSLSLEEISRRTIEARERGATEVCMQGGIHPDYTGETYLEILKAVKSAVPGIHVHAFSPLEVYQGASTSNMSVEEFLVQLKAAGLGSLPGTAAEILDDEVRNVLCPDKLKTNQWLEVMEAAHSIGLKTTSTIMFGHMDCPSHWATHLQLIKSLQKKTGGFTEFVPLPFVHMQAPIFVKGRARKGPTRRECVLMHAVSRLVLHPHITNIQASWVKMGADGAQFLLAVGCNDMGGCLMNESISKAAGALHGEELTASAIKELIHSMGRVPVQRSTLYKEMVHH